MKEKNKNVIRTVSDGERRGRYWKRIIKRDKETMTIRQQSCYFMLQCLTFGAMFVLEKKVFIHMRFIGSNDNCRMITIRPAVLHYTIILVTRLLVVFFNIKILLLRTQPNFILYYNSGPLHVSVF